MHVVAAISRKGAAGKTTLSVNLAVASVLAGGPVVVYGRLSRFFGSRSAGRAEQQQAGS